MFLASYTRFNTAWHNPPADTWSKMTPRVLTNTGHSLWLPTTTTTTTTVIIIIIIIIISSWISGAINQYNRTVGTIWSSLLLTHSFLKSTSNSRANSLTWPDLRSLTEPSPDVKGNVWSGSIHRKWNRTRWTIRPFGRLQNKLLNPMHYCVTICSTLHTAEREQLDSSSRYEPYRYTMIN